MKMTKQQRREKVNFLERNIKVQKKLINKLVRKTVTYKLWMHYGAPENFDVTKQAATLSKRWGNRIRNAQAELARIEAELKATRSGWDKFKRFFGFGKKAA